jgi:hypothetical protein
MAWSFSGGKACFSAGSAGDMLVQSDIMTIGQNYVLMFDVSSTTQGKLVIEGIDGTYEFTEDGTFSIYGTATHTSLFFIAQSSSSLLFDGCIDNLYLYTASGLVPTYTSPALNVMTQDDSLVLLEASNETDALNFLWEGTSLSLSTRIKSKFQKVSYETKLETDNDSSGERIVHYFDGQKIRYWQVDPVPVYIHDFLYLCIALDNVYINDVPYVIVEDTLPEIEWNKKQTEGTVEMKVRKRTAKLNKSNCG